MIALERMSFRGTLNIEDHDTYLEGDKVKVEGFRSCGWPAHFWEHFIEYRSETTLTHSPI